MVIRQEERKRRKPIWAAGQPLEESFMSGEVTKPGKVTINLTAPTLPAPPPLIVSTPPLLFAPVPAALQFQQLAGNANRDLLTERSLADNWFSDRKSVV